MLLQAESDAVEMKHLPSDLLVSILGFALRCTHAVQQPGQPLQPCLLTQRFVRVDAPAPHCQ